LRDCALFDFDGTITSSDTTKILIFELIKLRPLRLFFLSWLVIRIYVALLLKKNIQNYKNQIIGYLISGLSNEDLRVSLLNFQSKVKLLYRPFLQDKIKQHLQSNNIVLIVTAAPSFAIEGCIEGESVFVIGAEFEFDGNQYTGKFNHACYGSSKVDRIFSWKNQKKIELNYIEAWSDSFSDYSMLSLSNNRYWIGGKSLQDLITINDPSGNFLDKNTI